MLGGVGENLAGMGESITAYAIPTMGPEGCASWRWAAKAAELNRHTTRMKIRGSVVS